MIRVHQVNLQPDVGGGEIYTRTFSRALADAGARVSLYVDARNPLWAGLRSDRIEIVPVSSAEDILSILPGRNAFIVTQSRVTDAFVSHALSHHVLTGFSHMPMLGRSADEFRRYAIVFTVSQYCIDLLVQAGVSQTYAVPLYGTGNADLGHEAGATAGNTIQARSPYHWDRRKVRDRLYSAVESCMRPLLVRPSFVPRPGLTLGVVSLLSPIKQFPALFSIVAPLIARHPQVHLEIFGHGGYAQVRDLRKALAPMHGRVRFWGYQPADAGVYTTLDYLLTGLPEKEALGLNVLEAQSHGTPVLAPNAPPFTETVVDGSCGFLYRDPREDSGFEFAALLDAIVSGRPRPDPRLNTGHLARFSYLSMVDRCRALLAYVQTRYPETRNGGPGG